MSKNKSAYDIPELDEFAKIAMNAITQGLYSDPRMMEMFGTIAEQNKNSVNQEIAERSYLLAVAMIKRKQTVLNNVQE